MRNVTAKDIPRYIEESKKGWETILFGHTWTTNTGFRTKTKGGSRLVKISFLASDIIVALVRFLPVHPQA